MPTLTIGEHDLGVHSSAHGGPSPTYVLVHGLGTSHRYLARLHRELERVGTVHSIDLPGFGGMPKPPRALSIGAGAALLGAAIDRLGVTEVVLVGHSMGAQFVTELAAQRPALVSHLVLIGPVTDPARARPVTQAIDLARDTLKEPISGNLLTFADSLRCGPRWYFTELVPVLAYRTDQRLRTVEAPTLVIRGGDDPVARSSWCAKLVAAAPVGSLVEIPHHRHLVQHSAPGATARAVVAFSREAWRSTLAGPPAPPQRKRSGAH